MKRIIIVHGWGGSPNDNWLPWLKTKLEELGHKVVVPSMPDADNPVIEKWVGKLAEVVGMPDAETYLIGHSIGCQTILRYLETINTRIGGAIFVAGWFNLENLETNGERRLAEPWLKTSIDISKVKSVLPKSTLVISYNDDYGAFEENKQKFSEFVTKTVVLHQAGHIVDLVVPEILMEAKSLLQ
ncbi:MAG TPA: alpha/beta hydrolase [Candidatus Paceibacterota bacterium]|nr:alpha/beta hydrolase [Candidatus Paceibacterota bacterium]